MATSQNGWPVIASGSSPLLTSTPWITGKIRAGDAAVVLDYLAARFNAEVEPIRKAESWGYANREIRGSTAISNHASGTAEDYNAPSHPLGRAGTFTPAQVAAIRRILASLDGVVRWGGDYAGRKDEMHFELVKGPAAVAAVAARIRSGQLVSNPTAAPGAVPGAPSVSAPAPITPKEDDVAKLFTSSTTLGVFCDGPAVTLIANDYELESVRQAYVYNTGPEVNLAPDRLASIVEIHRRMEVSREVSKSVWAATVQRGAQLIPVKQELADIRSYQLGTKPADVVVDVDEAALAAAITARLGALSDADVQRIATASADEAARRLAS